MSRYSPKFEIGDIVQVVSKKSKYETFFGVFEGYTNGSNDNMCKVKIGGDIIYLMETSIKLITEKNIADLHYAEACKSIKEETMQIERNIELKYEGKHIRIGVHKLNGNTYMQQVGKDHIKNLWFRFEPEYYLDYEEYIKEYCDYLKKESNCPNMSYTNILGKDTLEHYIASFSPKRVDINGETVYDDGYDVRYSVQNYIDDMEGCMMPHKYYPIIEEVIIRVVDGCRYELEFKTKLEYRG